MADHSSSELSSSLPETPDIPGLQAEAQSAEATAQAPFPGASSGTGQDSTRVSQDSTTLPSSRKSRACWYLALVPLCMLLLSIALERYGPWYAYFDLVLDSSP